MKKLIALLAALLVIACSHDDESAQIASETPEVAAQATVAESAGLEEQPKASQVQVDRFADVQVLSYRVPGFDTLPLQEKKLVYYLSQAALSGRDMIYDQNYEHNLRIRRLLSAIVDSYPGDRASADYASLLEYAKRVWFANGIHHHYSSDKMMPGFSPEALAKMASESDQSRLPLDEGQTLEELLALLYEPMFSTVTAAKKVNLDPDIDALEGSATNYYRDVSADEATAFYASRIDEDPERPISWGLNSQLVKENGELRERTWKVGGMYSPAIEQIVYWLEKAATVAENERQRAWIERLVSFYRSGDLREYDAYNIAWVADTDSRVDTVNGFTEVYGDPLGYRGAWEAVLSIRDLEATHRISTIGGQAQWFEDHSPIMAEHKKKNVVGISAKVITVVVEGGDAAPSTPIGINLPNANWIRKEHGSKSVTLGNIMESYEIASAASGLSEEFSYTDEEKERSKKYSALESLLHTDMHEVIGHASGQINPGVGTPKETLKAYSSTLEEARADLVALYFIMDPKLVELGLIPSLDVGRTSYEKHIRNGLQLQLRRVKLGDDIEQAHMRNRQLIAAWAYEHGLEENVIEKIVESGKTYFVIRDYDALRALFGELLREIQRIKSEGDYEAASALVETYAVRVDQAMHKEVLERVAPLNIAAYAGFIQPRLVPVEENGEIIDVKVEYPDDFPAQMLEYEKKYSFLPNAN
ncbi:MAG: dipeptidyl peptidase 3 [Xanthomonadales bacterium]|nr:dipeptidyl peptidase 3 [Xanthomonadales bacterium]